MSMGSQDWRRTRRPSPDEEDRTLERRRRDPPAPPVRGIDPPEQIPGSNIPNERRAVQERRTQRAGGSTTKKPATRGAVAGACRPQPPRYTTTTRNPSARATVPGAVAVRAPGAASVQGTVFYRTADDNRTVYTREVPNNSDVIATAYPVNDDETSLLRQTLDQVLEQNRRLQERERWIREEGENQEQLVGGDEIPGAQVPSRGNDNRVPNNENKQSLKEKALSCLGSKGCAIAVVVVGAALIAAIVVPLVLTQQTSAEPTATGSSPSGTQPTTPVPTTSPVATTKAPTTTSPTPATAPPTTPAPSTTPPTTAATPLQDLMELLAYVSTDGGEALSTPGTPQYQAVNWLAGNTNLDSYSDDKKIQRYALATLYYSTGGDTWTTNTNWLDDGEECERWWQQSPSTLQCTGSGAIMELDLDLSNLKGSIPPEIGLFSESLERLDLFDNAIGGTIPSQIGQLTHLVELWLHVNSLTGTIPSEIGFLTKLTRLDLDSNPLTGTIPSSLASLTNLEQLEFDDDDLTGTIPSFLESLTNLEWLELDNNQLTGTIPSFFEGLTNLERLWLHNNQFSGSFSCPNFITDCYISCDDSTNEQCRSL